MPHSCVNCEAEAHIFRDDTYGEEGEWYCDRCYAADYFPDKLTVYAVRLGVNGTIQFLPDDSQCNSCGLSITDPSDRKSAEWEVALPKFA